MVWARLHKVEGLGAVSDYLIAIPNGGRRGKIESAMLKAEGVKAGVSDLFLAVPTRHYPGLWIEMKIKPNKPSHAQIDWLKSMALQGYAVAVAWSWEEARDTIINYLTCK
jgi:hypothetical protein